MPKLAYKTRKKILKENVFLRRSYDGYMQYGILELTDKRAGHTNVIGKIKDNFLQEELTYSYEDEFEKLKILEVVPANFYYKIDMDHQKIYISFERRSIKAHLFTNKEYVDGFYKFLSCFDEEEDIVLSCTLKTEKLKEQIRQFQKDVLNVRKNIYPNRYLTLEDAKKDVKTYLLYLMENLEVEIIEDELNEYLANMRKYYNNSDIEMFAGLLKEGIDGFSFSFIYKDKTYKVTIGSRKTATYFEDFDGFNDVYKEFISKG